MKPKRVTIKITPLMEEIRKFFGFSYQRQVELATGEPEKWGRILDLYERRKGGSMPKVFESEISEEETIFGSSKIDERYRITLTKPITKILGIEKGDLIVFVKDKEGRIYLRFSKISKLK